MFNFADKYNQHIASIICSQCVVVQLHCVITLVISSDTGGRKCQYGFESAKAACEDKPELETRAVGHVIVGSCFALLPEREKPLQLNSAQLAPNW